MFVKYDSLEGVGLFFFRDQQGRAFSSYQPQVPSRHEHVQQRTEANTRDPPPNQLDSHSRDSHSTAGRQLALKRIREEEDEPPKRTRTRGSSTRREDCVWLLSTLAPGRMPVLCRILAKGRPCGQQWRGPSGDGPPRQLFDSNQDQVFLQLEPFTADHGCNPTEFNEVHVAGVTAWHARIDAVRLLFPADPRIQQQCELALAHSVRHYNGKTPPAWLEHARRAVEVGRSPPGSPF